MKRLGWGFLRREERPLYKALANAKALVNTKAFVDAQALVNANSKLLLPEVHIPLCFAVLVISSRQRSDTAFRHLRLMVDLSLYRRSDPAHGESSEATLSGRVLESISQPLQAGKSNRYVQ